MLRRWHRYFRSSISRRFTALMVTSLSLILIGAIIVFWSTLFLANRYNDRITEINEKRQAISDLASGAKEIILHSRGYLVYQTLYENDRVFALRDELNKDLKTVRTYPLSASEQNLLQSIEDYFLFTFDQRYPKSVEYALANNYEAIRELVKADQTNPTNDMIAFARELELEAQTDVNLESGNLIRELSKQGLYFIIYVLLILWATWYSVRVIAKDVNEPLRVLSDTAGRVARGELVSFQYQSRSDEIGQLSGSLDTMMVLLVNKEEELVAQNEELIAQQDELQMQQEELQDALQRMEENERYLQKRNQLVQSLSNTLDKQELLQSIIRHMVEITGTDKGAIKLANANRDMAFFGISRQAADQFRATASESMLARVRQSKRIHTVTRECTVSEKGYHEDPMTATDFYIPVLGDNQEVAALIMLTRIGCRTGKNDEEEMMGLATQISLSLAKLEIYENSEYQRQINYDMLNTIQEAVQLMDLTGNTIHVNTKWFQLLGFNRDKLAVKNMSLTQFSSLMAQRVADPDGVLRFIMKQFEDGTYEPSAMNYELTLPEHRYIQIYFEPLYRGSELFGTLLVHRDITKEYEVDRMKSEFVSTVSHELRTPLASVLGFAELLLHKELKPERQRKYILTIHQEARRLTTLINDFLDLQRMESGRQSYDLKPLRLSAIIQEAIELQKVNAGQHRFEWKNTCGRALVLADRDKLQQVFTNLISNAVKYSPGGGTITIDCRQEGRNIVVDITDEGLGIPADALPKLFSKFYRVDNSDRREIGGTGLGLAIVKEIVNRHKGDVAVQSVLGTGSTFTVKLPVLDGNEQISDPESARGTTGKVAYDIMLVENNLNLSLLLRDELQSSGFRVHSFADGKAALEAVPDIKPHVVVLDIMLETGFSGWDFISVLRSDEQMAQTPIIISSAFEERRKAEWHDVYAFTIKPYLPGKLTEMIWRILRHDPD